MTPSLSFLFFFLLPTFLFVAVECQPKPEDVIGEVRTFNGTGNNLQNPLWGRAFLVCPTYNYNITQWNATINGTLQYLYPNHPRTVSRTLCAKPSLLRLHSRGVSKLFSVFGNGFSIETSYQLGCYSAASPGCTADDVVSLPAPTCDPIYDPLCTGKGKISTMGRWAYGASTVTTGWLDLSMIYGSSDDDYKRIRAPGGRINDTHIPVESMRLPGTPGTYTKNVAYPYLYSSLPDHFIMMDLWSSEHNRLADEFKAKYPNFTDDQIFQLARKWNIAFFQKIATREYAAPIFGRPLNPYRGYNPSLRPDADLLIPSMAARYGHLTQFAYYDRWDENYQPIDEGAYALHMNDVANFQMSKQGTRGMETLVRGLSMSRKYEPQPYHEPYLMDGTFDLCYHDVVRTRIQGLPRYNDVRRIYGLTPVKNFSQIGSNPTVQKILENLYGDVELVDVAIGAYCEDMLPGAMVGELMNATFMEHLTRVRDSDRLWYENIFSGSDLATIYNTTIRDLFVRNYKGLGDMVGMVENIFWVPTRQLAFQPPGLFLQDDFYDGNLVMSVNYKLSWKIEGNFIHFMIQVFNKGWVGIGFQPNDNTMKNADIVLCRVFPNASFEIIDSYAQDIGPPTADVDLGGRDDLFNKSGIHENGRTIIKFSRKLVTDDSILDKVIPDAKIKVIFAFNIDLTDFVYHGPTRSALTFINFFQTKSPKNVVSLGDPIRITLGVILLVCICVVSFSLVTVACFSDHFVIYSLSFTIMHTFGTLLSFVSVASLLFTPTDQLCAVFVWFLGLAITFTFGVIFIKLARIWKIFKNLAEMQVKALPDILLFKILLVMLLVEVVFLLIWQLVDPFKVEEVQAPGSSTDYHLQCSSNTAAFWVIFLVAHLLFIFLGVILTLKLRKLPNAIAEGQRLSFSIYTFFLISLIAVPLGSIFRNYLEIRVLVSYISILAGFMMFHMFFMFPVMIDIYIRRRSPKSVLASKGLSVSSSVHQKQQNSQNQNQNSQHGSTGSSN